MIFSCFFGVVLVFLCTISTPIDAVKKLCTPSNDPTIRDCNMCWCIANGIPLCTKLPCEKIPKSLWGQLELTGPIKQKRFFFLGGMALMMMAKCAIVSMVLMKGVLVAGAIKAILVAAALAAGPAMFALKAAIGVSLSLGTKGIMAMIAAGCGVAMLAMKIAIQSVGVAVNVGIPLIESAISVAVPFIASGVKLAMSFGFQFIYKIIKCVGQLTGVMNKANNYVNNYYPNNNVCYQPCSNNYDYCGCVNSYPGSYQCQQYCYSNNAYCAC